MFMCKEEKDEVIARLADIGVKGTVKERVDNYGNTSFIVEVEDDDILEDRPILLVSDHGANGFIRAFMMGRDSIAGLF
jgi:hypothetical protein